MKNKILLVDDEENILKAYQRILRSEYDIYTAKSAEEGMLLLKNKGPFAVVVSDFRMPKTDGITFLSDVRKLDPIATRIMLTGQADLQTSINAINEGHIFRFLMKPCPYEFFRKIIDDAVAQYELIVSEKTLLEKTLRGSIKVLVDLLSALNPVAFSQSLRLRSLARKLSIRMELDNLWEVEVTALLSQISVVTIPTEILAKINKGAFLDDKENKIYLKHPFFSKGLIENIPRLEKVAEGILYQLKNFDGSGFPDDELRGKDIPVLGRLMRLILEYDNLLIRTGNSEEALSIIRQNMKFFDIDIFKALEAEIYLIEKGFVIKDVSLDKLLIGMVLAEDIKNSNGVVLVSKNIEISEVLKTKLVNYASMSAIIEPIKVLDFPKR